MRPWLIGGKGNQTVKCPNCKRACHFLGPSISIPPKRDKKAWDQLRADIQEFQHSIGHDMQQEQVRRQHEIEKRIVELESRPQNRERDRLIKDLRSELSRQS